MIEVLRAARPTSYPIVSIEDGLAEDDWDGWTRADRARWAAGSSSSATTSSSPTRSGCGEGIEGGVANAILIKVNQIGTLTETLDAIEMAKRVGLRRRHLAPLAARPRTPSSRDLAVATNAGQIKTGSLSRSDRVAKYNQLLRIEEWLGEAARWPGTTILQGRP